MDKRTVVFFDSETNGLNPEDKYFGNVLSISAIKTEIDRKQKTMNTIDIYERFYFSPSGRYNHMAIEINGLNSDRIMRMRGNCEYPLYYKDDWVSFRDFCKGVTHFVAHNIKFDRRWVKFNLDIPFCTMNSNLDVVKKPSKKGDSYSLPGLLETAEFYNIEVDKQKAHGSSYDAYICKKIFYEMLLNDNQSVLNFLRAEVFK